MPEYIRALIVILVLATVVFALAKAPATAVAMSIDDFVRRRNTWFFITLAGFLSQNYWVFAVVVSLVIYNAAKKEHNKVALFFFLVLALPQIRVNIPGFAGINYLVTVDYVRILTVLLLFPICILEHKLARKNNLQVSWADKILACYIVLSLILQAQTDVATNVIRSALNWGVDVVVPYYAISRHVRSLKSFRDILMSFIVAALLVSSIGAFEFLRHWILYASAGAALGVEWNPGYLGRGEFLRATATSGQAIVLGYVLAMAIGFYLAVRRSVPSPILRTGAMVILLIGIVSPLSRGPWIGLLAIVFVFIALGDKRALHFSKFALFGIPLSVVGANTDFGRKLIDYLPFVGSVDNDNVTYRQNLFDTAFNIILDNPLFGSADYLLRMENLRQGQGLIDLVNTFIIVGLNTGFVGLGLYLLFFLTSMFGAYSYVKQTKKGTEIHSMGQALLAVMMGSLIIIATVSPIYHVPLLLWANAAFCLAYGKLKYFKESQ